jgi:hypothetical protein
MQCSKKRFYSITSSAMASNEGGTSRPSAFAVLRLMTSSNLVGACTGSIEFKVERCVPRPTLDAFNRQHQAQCNFEGSCQ